LSQAFQIFREQCNAMQYAKKTLWPLLLLLPELVCDYYCIIFIASKEHVALLVLLLKEEEDYSLEVNIV
jgi:hypothetical protein